VLEFAIIGALCWIFFGIGKDRGKAIQRQEDDSPPFQP